MESTNEKKAQQNDETLKETIAEGKIDALKKLVYGFYYEKKGECQRQYSLAESRDIGEIYEAIHDDKTVEMLFSRISIIVITANKYEKNVLHVNVSAKTKQRIKRINIKLWPQDKNSSETYAYYFRWYNYDVLHIEAQTTGSYTIGGAADIVRYVLENPHLYPSVVVSLGICFGIDEDNQTMGDTIISEKVYPYFMAAKINEAGLFVSDDNMFRINSQLHSKINTEIIDLNFLNGLGFNAYFGNYITGEAVVSNMAMRDCFASTTTQTVLAGDMEGYGLFKECFSGRHKIPCLTIKSICDWGASKNLSEKDLFQQVCGDTISDEELNSIKDRLQAYASYNAYRVLDILLEHQIFESSIYNRVVQEIKRKQGERNKIIYVSRVRTIIKKATQDALGNGSPSHDFILTVLKCLENDGILKADGHNSYLIIDGGHK